jgi:hypothetical protein
MRETFTSGSTRGERAASIGLALSPTLPVLPFAIFPSFPLLKSAHRIGEVSWHDRAEIIDVVLTTTSGISNTSIPDKEWRRSAEQRAPPRDPLSFYMLPRRAQKVRFCNCPVRPDALY